MKPVRQRAWWWALLGLPIGAALGLAIPAACSAPSRRCFAESTPSDMVMGVIIGAVLGLASGILILWAQRAFNRDTADLQARFPNSLVVRIRSDRLTARAANELGVGITAGRVMVLVADDHALQLWMGGRASTRVLDAPWARVGAAIVGDPTGDIFVPSRLGYAVPAYERLAVDIAVDGHSVRLQFPVLALGSGSNPAAYCDAYDLRMLARKINGYRELHLRTASSARDE